MGRLRWVRLDCQQQAQDPGRERAGFSHDAVAQLVQARTNKKPAYTSAEGTPTPGLPVPPPPPAVHAGIKRAHSSYGAGVAVDMTVEEELHQLKTQVQVRSLLAVGCRP
jgi:hypothetical protein